MSCPAGGFVPPLPAAGHQPPVADRGRLEAQGPANVVLRRGGGTDMPQPITSLEGEVYYPPQEVIAQAHVPDWSDLLQQAEQDYLGFWEARGLELEWQAPWQKVMDDSRAPFYKWFLGARTN